MSNYADQMKNLITTNNGISSRVNKSQAVNIAEKADEREHDLSCSLIELRSHNTELKRRLFNLMEETKAVYDSLCS